VITAEQIKQIAALPDDADFRFKLEFGITTVDVKYANGDTLTIDEDGTRTIVSANGRFMSSFTPFIVTYDAIDDALNRLDRRPSSR
jgi:hypothetical protein